MAILGQITFFKVNTFSAPTFVDYLKAGIHLNLITAIDFTSSNRPPTDPTSLHFLDPESLNAYQECITQLGSLLCPYDPEQLFAVYGFGGKIRDVANHCFSLNFNDEDPFVTGFEGILDVYKSSITQVPFHGPTLFTPIIRTADFLSKKKYEANRTYTVLLILTDGVINDMNDTIDAIVNASSDAPLSIIIVGIGPSNFDAMSELHPEDKLLKSSSGDFAKRDIVQFFTYRDFIDNLPSLAPQLLYEIPFQVRSFCESRKFTPPLFS